MDGVDGVDGAVQLTLLEGGEGTGGVVELGLQPFSPAAFEVKDDGDGFLSGGLVIGRACGQGNVPGLFGQLPGC